MRVLFLIRMIRRFVDSGYAAGIFIYSGLATHGAQCHYGIFYFGIIVRKINECVFDFE